MSWSDTIGRIFTTTTLFYWFSTPKLNNRVKKLKELLVVLYCYISIHPPQPSLKFPYQTQAEKPNFSKFQILLNLSAGPLHPYAAQARPRLHYFVQWKPLLGPWLGPLFRRALGPHLRPERLGVRHVVGAVWVSPEESFPARALGRRYRGVGPGGGVGETRGALRGAAFELVAREAPFVVVKVSAIGDGYTSGNRTWERGRDVLVIWVFTGIRDSPWSWSRPVGINLNDFRTSLVSV